MFHNPLTEEDHEELANANRMQQTRTIVMCGVILVILVLLAIWLL